MPFAATQMDLKNIILWEINQRKTNIWYHSYVNLIFKIIQINHFANQKQTYSYGKQAYDYQRGNMVGKHTSGAWDKHTHTAMYKIDIKDLWFRTGIFTEYLWQPIWE